MRAKRLVTWPFAAFLFGYGVPMNDPTVVTLADEVLSGTALGFGLALIVGLPLALIFRRGDREFSRATLMAMAVALTATVILDLAGLGLIGAALFLFAMRASRSKGPKAASATDQG